MTNSHHWHGQWRWTPISANIGKLEWLLFRMVSRYGQYILSFRHKARLWQIDGRPDRQTDLITIPNTAIAIADASRGKKQCLALPQAKGTQTHKCTQKPTSERLISNKAYVLRHKLAYKWTTTSHANANQWPQAINVLNPLSCEVGSIMGRLAELTETLSKNSSVLL